MISCHRVTPTSQKVFIITHELSRVSNISQHIEDIFDPLPVYFLLGRSAKAQPVCKPEKCLFYTWKEGVDSGNLVTVSTIIVARGSSGPMESLHERMASVSVAGHCPQVIVEV